MSTSAPPRNAATRAAAEERRSDDPAPPLNINQIIQLLQEQSRQLFQLATDVWLADSPELPSTLEPDRIQSLMTEYLMIKAQTMQSVLMALTQTQQMMYGIGVQVVRDDLAVVAQASQQLRVQHSTQINELRERAEELLPRNPRGVTEATPAGS